MRSISRMLVAVLLAGSVVHAAETWTRLHCALDKPDGASTEASYTVLTGPAEPRMQRTRVLYNTLGGRQLVADLSFKRSADGKPGDSRWMNLYLLPGGRHLNISIVAQHLDVYLDGEALQTLDLAKAAESIGEFQQLRELLPPSLLQAVRELALTGEALEPAFRTEAQLLLKTVLAGDDELNDLPTLVRRVELPVAPFTADDRPAKAEEAFGVLFKAE